VTSKPELIELPGVFHGTSPSFVGFDIVLKTKSPRHVHPPGASVSACYAGVSASVVVLLRQDLAASGFGFAKKRFTAYDRARILVARIRVVNKFT
jgi:hypothetical protein